jgi:hypothetical protein
VKFYGNSARQAHALEAAKPDVPYSIAPFENETKIKVAGE